MVALPSPAIPPPTPRGSSRAPGWRRPHPRCPPTPLVSLSSARATATSRIRVDRIERLLADRPGAVLTVRRTPGDDVPLGGSIATLNVPTIDEALRADLLDALPIEEQRDIGCDAGFGIEHPVNIAWATVSTAKSNPAVGVVACHALGDILFRWARDGGMSAQRSDAVVCYDDRVMQGLLDGIETLVVVASESMQHQALAASMDAIAAAFEGFPEPERDRLVQILLTSLTALGDHLPTAMPEASFATMTDVLDRAGRNRTADTVRDGWHRFVATHGQISSRGNRAG